MKRMTLVIGLVIAFLGAGISAQTLEARLQKAIQAETVTGDLRAAIREYRRIADDAKGNRRVAAQALIRMAECHRKLGDAEAAKIFERVTREFGDQADAAAEARAKLASLRGAARRPGAQMSQQVWSDNAVDPMGAPSADGRYLSFTDWTTGDLAIRDLAARTTRRLTNSPGWSVTDAFAEFSVPSPDGREVLYAWYNGDHPDKLMAYELRVIPTATADTKPRVLIAAGSARWIMPGSWTPDGRSVVFMRESRNGRFEIGILAAGGGDVTVLAEITSPSQRIHVSPDGRWVAFDQHPAGKPAARDIFVLPIQGGQPVPVVTGPATDQMALWTPDGSHLVFVSTRTGSNALWSVAMRNGRPAGAPEVVRPDVGQFYPLGITRAGTLYYFEGGSRDNVMQAPLGADGNVAGPPAFVSEQYVNSNSSPAISPDGRYLAFHIYPWLGQQGNASIVIRDLKDGSERQHSLGVSVVRTAFAALRWFPDGRGLLVCGRNRETRSTIYARLDVPTGKEETLLELPSRGATSCSPAVAADGSGFFFVDQPQDNSSVPMLGGPRGVKYFDFATRTTRTLLEAWPNTLALSPDGRTLAVLMARDGESRTGELVLLPVGGGERKVLYSAPWYDSTRFNTLGWSSDGRRIFFVRPEGDGNTQVLWSVGVDGSDARKAGISLPGRIKHPAAHPDGRTLFYSAREFGGSAIWTLDNFLPAKR